MILSQKVILLYDISEVSLVDRSSKEQIRRVFAENIKQLRVERNLTQKQMADLIEVSVSSVAMWESGDRETDFSTLNIIADKFDVTIDFLLGRAANLRQNKKLIMEDGQVIGYIVLYQTEKKLC